MARSLDAILAELSSSYAGSENSLNSQLQAVPGQVQSQIAAADAKLGQANDSILSSARGRGLGFSGIPVGEQAKYAATEYAPAVANLQATGTQKALSLNEALQQLGRDKRSQAQGIFDNETARDFQQQQFAESQRQFNEQLAASNRASGGGGGGYNFGGLPLVGPAPAAKKATDPVQQNAYNDVKSRISKSNDKQLLSDFVATASSAQRGNQKDLYKISLYRQLRPDLFNPNTRYSWEK